jgi:hypothetical protein
MDRSSVTIFGAFPTNTIFGTFIDQVKYSCDTRRGPNQTISVVQLQGNGSLKSNSASLAYLNVFSLRYLLSTRTNPTSIWPQIHSSLLLVDFLTAFEIVPSITYSLTRDPFPETHRF